MTSETKSWNGARLVWKVDKPTARVLLLGYDEERTSIAKHLIERGCEVWHTEDKIETTTGFDLVVSFGYRHILKAKTISSSLAPIVNLHISFLPWNRGAHPNFWSFFDCTPSGVTIHLVDPGIDTGDIIYQKYVNFRRDETTFAMTYRRLISEIERLFEENADELVARTFVAYPQRRPGTYHRSSDLPAQFSGWDADIRSEITRLDAILGTQHLAQR